MYYSPALTPAARGCALGAVLEEAVILHFFQVLHWNVADSCTTHRFSWKILFSFPWIFLKLSKKIWRSCTFVITYLVPVLPLVYTHRVIPTHLRETSLGFLSADHLLRIWEMRPGFPEHITLRTCSMEHTNAWFWLGKYQMENWQLWSADPLWSGSSKAISNSSGPEESLGSSYQRNIK